MASWRPVARRTLDEHLRSLRPLAGEPRPHRGWVRAVREALGMSTVELAARMGVSQPRIAAVEQGEQSGSIRLKTLERAAEALGCRLVYAFVPETSLEDAAWARARRKAALHLGTVSHSMRLEDQAVDDAATARQVEDLAAELIDRRGLWTDPA